MPPGLLSALAADSVDLQALAASHSQQAPAIVNCQPGIDEILKAIATKGGVSLTLMPTALTGVASLMLAQHAQQTRTALADSELVLKVLWAMAVMIRDQPDAIAALTQLVTPVYALKFTSQQHMLGGLRQMLAGVAGEVGSRGTAQHLADYACQHGYADFMEGRGFAVLCEVATPVMQRCGVTPADPATTDNNAMPAPVNFEQTRQTCQAAAAVQQGQQGDVSRLLEACGVPV